MRSVANWNTLSLLFPLPGIFRRNKGGGRFGEVGTNGVGRWGSGGGGDRCLSGGGCIVGGVVVIVGL